MTVELRIEPLTWRLWPVYETGNAADFPAEQPYRQVAIGPLRLVCIKGRV